MKQFRQMPDFWKIPKAMAYAAEHGLKTKYEDGVPYVENLFYPAEVDIDSIEGKYPCWLLKMDDWNGWKIPYMTKETAMKVVEDVNKANDPLSHFVIEGDTIILKNDDWPDDSEEVTPSTITVGGLDIEVYQMGLGWVWSEVTKEEQEEN